MPEFVDVAEGLQMPLADAMATQRAVRRLRPDPVDDETVLALIRLAVKAPTAGNLQGFEFLVVRDPGVKHQLARLNRQAWSLYRRGAKRKARGNIGQARIIAAVQWQADHFEDAPVIIVACMTGAVWPTPAGRTSYYGSIFPAVQNLLLAARAMGLGAALTTLPLWSRTLARRTLSLPRNVTPCAVIPLGWPRGGGYGPSTRRAPEEVLHVDRWGNRAYLNPDSEHDQAPTPVGSSNSST